MTVRDPSRVTPPSALEIAAAIQAAHRKLPGVDIAIADLGDDSAWLVDHCCRTVRLSDRLPRARLATAIDQAVAALVTEERRSGWCPGQLPHPRTQDHRIGRAG